MDATVVVSTKNRKDELRRALQSAQRQTVQPEILVVDDGSSDGTSELVREEFPAVKLITNERSQGYIACRNLAAAVAAGGVIVSIDDDAEFSTPYVVEQALQAFDDDRVGAIAIPYVDVRKDEVVRQVAPTPFGIYVVDRYIGTAHAVRRDLFLRLGGYRESFVHQGEEGEFCARLMQAGYFVRVVVTDTIHHFESPRRDLRRMDYYGRRNDILAAVLVIPMPDLFLYLPAVVGNGLLFSFKTMRFGAMLRGVIAGLVACFCFWNERRPVDRGVFKVLRRLRRYGPIRVEAIDPTIWQKARCFGIYS